MLARALATLGTPAAVLWALWAWAVSILVQETNTPPFSWRLGATLIWLLPLALNLAGWVLLIKRAPRASVVCSALPVALVALIIVGSFRN